MHQLNICLSVQGLVRGDDDHRFSFRILSIIKTEHVASQKSQTAGHEDVSPKIVGEVMAVYQRSRWSHWIVLLVAVEV